MPGYKYRWARGSVSVCLMLSLAFLALTPLLALSTGSSPAAGCCRAKHNCCCRKEHHDGAQGGPTLTGTRCLNGCGVVMFSGIQASWLVRHSDAGANTIEAARVTRIPETLRLSYSFPHSLWQRPPPAFLLA